MIRNLITQEGAIWDSPKDKNFVAQSNVSYAVSAFDNQNTIPVPAYTHPTVSFSVASEESSPQA